MPLCYTCGHDVVAGHSQLGCIARLKLDRELLQKQLENAERWISAVIEDRRQGEGVIDLGPPGYPWTRELSFGRLDQRPGAK